MRVPPRAVLPAPRRAAAGAGRPGRPLPRSARRAPSSQGAWGAASCAAGGWRGGCLRACAAPAADAGRAGGGLTCQIHQGLGVGVRDVVAAGLQPWERAGRGVRPHWRRPASAGGGARPASAAAPVGVPAPPGRAPGAAPSPAAARALLALCHWLAGLHCCAPPTPAAPASTRCAAAAGTLGIGLPGGRPGRHQRAALSANAPPHPPAPFTPASAPAPGASALQGHNPAGRQAHCSPSPHTLQAGSLNLHVPQQHTWTTTRRAA
jgi:hypothetical protein